MASHSHDVLRHVPRIITDAGTAPPRMRDWLTITEGVTPRDAATVIVFDADGRDAKVWLMMRHGKMTFAPNRVVFPGGAVDPIDLSAPDPIRAAAVRELAEEADLHLTPEDLWLWARWITPVFESRRYDTWFFVARLPEGQQARDVSGEADRADWMRPADALAAHDAGVIQLLAPTWSVLKEMADLGSFDAVVAAASDRIVEPVLGEIRLVDDTYEWYYPGDER